MTREEAIEKYGEPDERGHVTRVSFDASSYDEICVLCGATDMAVFVPSIYKVECPR